MRTIAADYNHRYTVSADVETARAHFADLATIAANYGPLDTHEITGERTMKLLLPKQNHGITSITPHYECTWSLDHPGEVRWTTTPGSGNLDSSGTARFTPSGAGCTMEWTSRIALTIDVNRFVGKALEPIVATFVRREMSAYVDRMIKALG